MIFLSIDGKFYMCWDDIYSLVKKIIKSEEITKIKEIPIFDVSQLTAFDFIITVDFLKNRKHIVIESNNSVLFFSLSLSIDNNTNQVKLNREFDEGLGTELASLIEEYFYLNNYDLEVIE